MPQRNGKAGAERDKKRGGEADRQPVAAQPQPRAVAAVFAAGGDRTSLDPAAQVGDERLHRAVAVSRVDAHGARDDGVDVTLQPVAVAGRRNVVFDGAVIVPLRRFRHADRCQVQDRVFQRGSSRLVRQMRPAPGQQVVSQTSERIDVARDAGGLTADLFRRRIFDGKAAPCDFGRLRGCGLVMIGIFQ